MDENRTLTSFYGSNKEPRRGQRSGDRRGQKEHGIKQYKGRDPLGWGSGEEWQVLQRCPVHERCGVPVELGNEEVIDSLCDPSFSGNMRAKPSLRGVKTNGVTGEEEQGEWVQSTAPGELAGEGKLQPGPWGEFVIVFY